MLKEQSFTKTIPWKVLEEATELTWQIKTIGHQWQKLGYFMIFMLVVCFIIFVAILIHGYQFLMTPLMPVVAASIISLFLFGELRRKCWFVYRLTKTAGEVCHWRAYPKGLFIAIRWLFALLSVIALIAGVVIGSGILAALAPLGAILSIGSFAVTKDYQETMTAFSHRAYDWAEITEAEYDTKRNVIRLHYKPEITPAIKQKIMAQGIKKEDFGTIILEWDCFLFLTPELTEQVLAFTKKSLPANISLEYKTVELPEVV